MQFSNGLNIYHVFRHGHGHGHGHDASVWVFLDGVASCELELQCDRDQLRTIDLPKGRLEMYTVDYLDNLSFKIQSETKRAFPGFTMMALFSSNRGYL